MELPKEYQTGLQRLNKWLERNDNDILCIGCVAIGLLLIVDYFTGGLLT